MTKCLKDKPYGIAYIDSGHGHKAGLEEVRLKNLEGNFLNVREADEKGGIQQAERDVLPEGNATVDFSEVSLINRPGEYTWPMVALTYVYVRTNLNKLMPNHETRSLLITWLRALYRPEYIKICEKYDFKLPSDDITTYGIKNIDLLIEMLNKDANETHKTETWVFEEAGNTQKIVGAGDYVISAKRHPVEPTDLDEVADNVAMIGGDLLKAEAKLNEVGEKVQDLTGKLNTMEVTVDGISKSPGTGGGGQPQAPPQKVVSESFGSDEETQLTAALVLSCLSFVFSVVIMGATVVRCVTKP